MRHLGDFVSMHFGQNGVSRYHADAGVCARRTIGPRREYDGAFSLSAELVFDLQADFPGTARGRINHLTIRVDRHQGGDGLRAFMQDRALHLLRAFQAALAVAGAHGAAIGVRLRHMNIARNQRAELRRHAAAAGPAAAQAGAGQRRAMVGAAPAQHLPAVRLAVQVVVVLRDLERGLVRLRPAGDEVCRWPQT